MKCPLRGTDCREDCRLWVDGDCAIVKQYKQTRRAARALEALIQAIQAGIK